MIVFDIRCSSAHVFEAWFGSTEDWEDQRRRKLVSCPVCGSGEVEKAVMAPAVAAKGNRRPDAGAAPVPMSGRSEEHTSELQSLMRISYAVFCLKKKKTRYTHRHIKTHAHATTYTHYYIT